MDNYFVLPRMLPDGNASVSRSTRLIRVVDLRLCLHFLTAAGSLLHTVVISYTEVLCSRANDLTASEAIALTRSTPTRLLTLHDVHPMDI